MCAPLFQNCNIKLSLTCQYLRIIKNYLPKCTIIEDKPHYKCVIYSNAAQKVRNIQDNIDNLFGNNVFVGDTTLVVGDQETKLKSFNSSVILLSSNMPDTINYIA